MFRVMDKKDFNILVSKCVGYLDLLTGYVSHLLMYFNKPSYTASNMDLDQAPRL